MKKRIAALVWLCLLAFLGTPIRSQTIGAPPLGIHAQATSNSVTVTWTQSIGSTGTCNSGTGSPTTITGNSVFRGNAPGAETRYAMLAQAMTTFTDTHVTPGASYWYYATASNCNGESQPSDEVSAVIPGGTGPPVISSATEPITVLGSNFAATSVVSMSGAPCPTTFVSVTQLQGLCPVPGITVANVAPPPSISVWPENPTPGFETTDNRSLEVGVQFKTAVAGSVTGVRFYKGPHDTGTHIGNLWSSTGTQLASIMFTSETASGWQQANFSTPVALTVGTTYLISYWCPTGFFSVTRPYTWPHVTGPLTAILGVYQYGTASLFPSQPGYQTSNYWADVIFQPQQ